MEKAVVTGALGFIGFHLTDKLLNEGVSVIGIDNLADPKRTEIQEEKLMHLLRNSNFDFKNSNISSSEFQNFIDDNTVVYHLASPIMPFTKLPRIAKAIEDSISETKAIVNVLQKKPVPLIYTSSMQVYGKRYGTISEKTPVNPLSDEGRLKGAEEAYLLKRCSEIHIPLIIIRLPSVYGPWQREDMAYHRLLTIKDKRHLEKVEDAFTADIIYVDDVVDAFINASKISVKKEIINLTSGKEGEWHKGKEWITGERINLREDPFFNVRISTDHASKILGFKPSVAIEQGVEKQKAHIEKMMKTVPSLYSV
ncbi:NAD-dependent epimerase/dehydratase family protein [Pseudalkalibacillus caeni]|uniref:NAD-dependent epimerase/dehydratase family protein n=1 Tax=Exobacillus caeni TaxID=2574798 RepID=UPI001485BED2|nr:NAD(P)-dependent oxidoreductase [Pseudalkalibacillus caeni]